MSLNAIELRAEVVHFIAHYLRVMLPPPFDTSASELVHRDRAAAALIGELKPATIAEAECAGIAIATAAHAMDSLRMAGILADDSRRVMQCRAQASGMLRQSTAARRALAQLQAQRAVASEPVQPAAASGQHTAPVQHAAPGQHAALQLEATPQGAPPAEPSAPALAAAEKFARDFPRRAIQIRRAGRLPAGIGYQPPAPEVIRALVTGRSPVLRKLDRKTA